MQLWGAHRKTDSSGYCRRPKLPAGQLEQRVGNIIPASPIIVGVITTVLGLVVWQGLGSKTDKAHNDSAFKSIPSSISTGQQPDLFSIANIDVQEPLQETEQDDRANLEENQK